MTENRNNVNRPKRITTSNSTRRTEPTRRVEQSKTTASSKRAEQGRKSEQSRRTEQTGRTTQIKPLEKMKSSNKTEEKKSPNRYPIKLTFKVLLLLFLITILLLGIIFYMTVGKDLITWQQDAKSLVYKSNAETFRQTETSIVYDTNGEQITTLKGVKDVYYIEYEDIPDYAIEAMISIEDKKFETHSGIDLKAIVRALKAYIDNGGEITQGASTITQQLSRNIFLTHEVSWERKIKEIFIALELEKKYTKPQIMEFYLNNIYFGNGYYGIQAASKGYFNREVTELSLGEIAFLCAIPNNPTLYDPMDNYDNTVKRKNRIIEQMYEDGKITLTEKNDAVYEEIQLETTKKKKQNYIETYIYYCATQALMESRGFVFRYSFGSEEEREEYDEAYSEMYTICQQSLYSAGYRIYTSIDTDIQAKLQNAVDGALAGFTETSEEGIFSLQGAATTIDNETGRVIAIVGGRSQKTTGYTLNRAYQSYRQPGSAIKPLIVYTPAFERGYTPNTIVTDEPFEGGPKNSSRTYSGKITIRKAVESSKNTIAWKLFEELTPSIGLQYLLNMNFAKIDRNDYYPAASLGGFTKGVSAVEMASAFAALENDGVYRVPTCIVKIMDSNGKTIVGEDTDSRIIYDSNASRMMTDVLRGVFTSGTGKGLGLSNMAAAGKTGTTDDKKDGWFVGYTPYYTTSVWVGYDLPKTLSSLSGSSYPGTIWHNFMEELHEGLEYREFVKYDSAKGDKLKVEEEKEEEIPMEEDVIDDEAAIFEEDDQTETDEISGELEDNMEFEAEEDDIIDSEEDNFDDESYDSDEEFQEEPEDEFEGEEDVPIEEDVQEDIKGDIQDDFEEDTSLEENTDEITEDTENGLEKTPEENLQEGLKEKSEDAEDVIAE